MSYVSSYYHCVFSTKGRRPLITPDLRERLWPFLGGIARQNQMKALEVGGMPDHAHVLLSIPATLSIAKALQLIRVVLPNGFMTHFRIISSSGGK